MVCGFPGLGVPFLRLMDRPEEEPVREFQMDGREFEAREDLLRRLPATLVIEHIGKFLEPVPVEHPGFRSLLRLVDGGRCWVKLSGAYMMSKSGPPLYADVGVLAKALVARAPERLVWASNWPVCTLGGDFGRQIELAEEYLASFDRRVRDKVMYENAGRFYRRRG